MFLHAFFNLSLSFLAIYNCIDFMFIQSGSLRLSKKKLFEGYHHKAASSSYHKLISFGPFCIL